MATSAHRPKTQSTTVREGSTNSAAGALSIATMLNSVGTAIEHLRASLRNCIEYLRDVIRAVGLVSMDSI